MWQGLNWQELSRSGKLGFVLAGVLACVGGVITLTSLTVLIGSGQVGLLLKTEASGSTADEFVLAGASETPVTNSIGLEDKSSSGQMIVDVSGAVNSPGIYELPTGSRLGVAIDKARGFSLEADVGAIARELNLASVLQDGQKIYIPFQSDSISQGSNGASISQIAGVQSSGLVSINKASRAQLMELEGIGEKRAEAIIAGRPYTSIDQLVSEGALTAGVFAKIQAQLEL